MIITNPLATISLNNPPMAVFLHPGSGNLTIYLLEADKETFLFWKLLISLYIDSLIYQEAVQYFDIPQGIYKCRQILIRTLRGGRGHYKLTKRVLY